MQYDFENEGKLRNHIMRTLSTVTSFIMWNKPFLIVPLFVYVSFETCVWMLVRLIQKMLRSYIVTIGLHLNGIMPQIKNA